MAKDNGGAEDGSSSSSGGGGGGGNNLSTPSSSTGSQRAGQRSRPYDANNSFVKKVATRMSDLIPQRSWISKWFNNSQEESSLKATETGNPDYETYEDKQSQPPPLKRPCIRMDVTHPPGTFTIKPRSRNTATDTEPSKEHFTNHNETTQDFLEPTTTGPRFHRFVSSTPAYQPDAEKASNARSTLNILMSEQNNGAANGMDDNSESSESTSGCSSLIPQNNRQEAPSNANYDSPFANKRRYIDEKLSFTNHLQSPRSLFLDSTNRDTLGSRRPSFNPSMMSNTLTRSSSLSSPFYSGNTTFGGANAAHIYRSNSVLSEPPQPPKRTSVEVNPSTESSTSDLSGMSHTARRILEALEQFSSPITDAKKIPVRNVMGGSNSSPTFSRKRMREDETASPRVGLRHLTRELMVPTVPDLMRIRRRQKLQNTTVNARKIMTARNATNAPATQEYHIRTEEDAEPKRNEKLKAKKKTNLEEQETVEAVNLPTIPLPISSLPRFDLPITLPQRTKPTTPEKQKQTKLSDKDNSFKFASPIKLSDGAKNLESINNFTFSKPISPSKMNSSLSMNDSQELSKTLSVDSNDTLSYSSSTSFPNFIWAGPSQTLKPKEKEKVKEEEPKGPKVATELKSGSVMDFFAKNPSTSSELPDVWECNECLIKNNGKETHCVACKSAKLDDSDDIEILECPVSNKDSKLNTQKQEDATKNNITTFGSVTSSPRLAIFGNSNAVMQSTKTPLFNTTVTTTAREKSKVETITIDESPDETSTKITTTTNSPMLSAFKPAKSSWECPCCMVQNVETVTTCPCCNTAKPGSVNVSPKRTTSTSIAPTATITSGFGDQFKKPEGSWSCDTCMIQNKADDTKCVACETPKPGAAKPATIKPATTTSGFGDMFKKAEGSWTCDSCMLSNKAEATKCIACETAKPGGEAAKPTSKLQFNVDMPANASTFKFGIDKAEDAAKSTAATLPKTNGFTFGNSTSIPATGLGFCFGVANANKNDTNDSPKSNEVGFKPSETVPATATFNFGAKSETVTKEKEDTKPSATANFSFGAPAKTEVKPATTGFVFGSPSSVNNVTEKKTEEKTESTKPVTAEFTFGAPASTTPQVNKDTNNVTSATPAENNKEVKPVSDAPAASNFLFGSPKPAINVQAKDIPKKEEEAKPTTAPIPAFGAPAEQPKPATPNFNFGSNATAATAQSAATSVPASKPSLFMFSGPPKPAETPTQNATPLPAFGSPAAPKPTFSFGKPAETTPITTPTPTLQQTENKAPTLTFGSSATTPAFGSQTNQTTPSLFGNVNASTTPTPSLGDNKPLMFGAPENKITPTFGATTDNTLTSTFGAAAKPATSGFPSTVTSSPAASPFGTAPSAFGSSAPSTFGSNTSSPGLFVFGQTSQAPAPSIGGFNFSAGSNAASTAAAPAEQKNSGIFTFGASSGGPVGNGFGGGAFGSAAPGAPAANANPTASFSFNAPQDPKAATTSGFNPPTASAASTPMFNVPVNMPVQPVSGGFNFCNTDVPKNFSFGSPPAPASTGFKFNAPTTTPSAPVTFDPNATPTFNFTGGSAPAAFNAPPRKIKKAVRRMPRQ